jgi:hypothetical protein
MISYFDTAYPTIYKLKAVFIVERLLSDSEHTAKLSSGKNKHFLCCPTQHKCKCMDHHLPEYFNETPTGSSCM